MPNIVSYLVFPHTTVVEATQRFWAGKARLAMEGKMVSGVPLDFNRAPLRNSEIVIVAYDNWDSDPYIHQVQEWAGKYAFPLRVVHPFNWRDLPVVGKRKKAMATV